jgi:hypothetical protein
MKSQGTKIIIITQPVSTIFIVIRKHDILPEVKEDVERGLNDSTGPQVTPKISEHKPRELSELFLVLIRHRLNTFFFRSVDRRKNPARCFWCGSNSQNKIVGDSEWAQAGG